MKSPDIYSNRFIKVLAGGLISTIMIGGTGCGEKAVSAPTPIIRTLEQERSQIVPEIQTEKQYLKESINGLSESPIKNMLTKRVSPFLEEICPQDINLAGISVPMRSLTVKFENVGDKKYGPGFSGSFTGRKENSKLPNATAIKDTSILVPYIGLSKPSDKNFDDTFLPDGTHAITLNLPAGGKIISGFDAEICINASSSQNSKNTENTVRQKELEDRKKFVAVKESLQFTINQVMIKMMIEKMNDLGQPIIIEAREDNGTISQIEIATGIFESIASYHGRSLAAMDIAATVIAIKAYSQEEITQILKTDSKLLKAVMALKDVDLGKDENTILLNALNWVMNNPLAETIYHYGDLDLMP